MKVKWTKTAREQFKEILRFYTKRNQSTVYAVRLKHDMFEFVKHFRKNPFFGEQLGEDGSIRRVSNGNFVIVYEVKPDAVEIFSVRDGRRDVK